MNINDVASSVDPEDICEQPRFMEFVRSGPFSNIYLAVGAVMPLDAAASLFGSTFMLGLIVGLLHPEEVGSISGLIKVPFKQKEQ
jgi:hypothetical protein